MDGLSFSLESPLGEDLATLFARHTAEMHAETPPESVHMMPHGALVSPDINFFVLRRTGLPVGMAALKRLDRHHGEIKSMHVLSELRGGGLSRLMLDRLIAHAQAAGLTRLFLETGAQPGFAPARGLYGRMGFAECPPFGQYRPDPNSVFMTRAI